MLLLLRLLLLLLLILLLLLLLSTHIICFSDGSSDISSAMKELNETALDAFHELRESKTRICYCSVAAVVVVVAAIVPGCC